MFYFILALAAVTAGTANAVEPVLDTDGNTIFDGSYYVLPAISGAADGGLNLSSIEAQECPLYVGQEDSKDNMGIPVKFSNWKSKVGFVPESESLNIEMDVKATVCGQSTYWWARVGDSLFHTLFIEAGPKPDGGDESRPALFQIKKDEDSGGYNIEFCPTDNYCNSVAVIVDAAGFRRLAVVPEPFQVRFVKASEAESSSGTMSII